MQRTRVPADKERSAASDGDKLQQRTLQDTRRVIVATDYFLGKLCLSRPRIYERLDAVLPKRTHERCVSFGGPALSSPARAGIHDGKRAGAFLQQFASPLFSLS